VGIEAVLGTLRSYLTGKVLDLGCGDGLATKLLGGDCIGCDQSSEMISRYHQETGCPGYVRTFWDELPLANSAVAVYSMHLCEPSRVSMMWYRLNEAGAESVVVITPLKSKPDNPNAFYSLVDSISEGCGPDGKVIHGKVYRRSQPR
jgi:SAM-dependent methyltransferase